MNIVQKVFKNILSLFCAQFIVAVLSIILSVSIARSLGDVIFGKYAFAGAFVALFVVFLDLGYDTLLIREVARNKTKASMYLNNILCFRALLSPLVVVLAAITINMLGYPADTRQVVYIFIIYSVLVSLSNVFKVTFRAFERMEYDAGIRIFSNTIRCLLGILIIFLGYGLVELALIFLFSGIIEFLSSFFVCKRKFIEPRIECNFSFLSSTIKVALLIGTMTIFGSIYVRTDTIMLSVIKGDAVVGWYNAAYELVLGFRPIPQLFMHSLLPLLSLYYISSKNSLQRAYEKSFKYLVVIGLPITVGICLLAENFIILLYGDQFINSVIALKILAWDILLKFLYICAAFILVSTNKQKQMAMILGSTALINIILNLFLIPYFSYVGAALATIATETFLLISYIYLNSRSSFKLKIQKIMLKPVIACAVMAFFIYQFSEINLILKISVSILIYFAVLFLLKGFSDDDISLFKSLIKR